MKKKTKKKVIKETSIKWKMSERKYKKLEKVAEKEKQFNLERMKRKNWI